MAQTLDQLTRKNMGDQAEPRIRFVQDARRVRVMFGGQMIADSQQTVLVVERRRLPVYYFPLEDVRRELLSEAG
ncbi:MAG TPA: DUF427 domain-containing protein, partial [Candidatus Sulfotelmatobacter sp.]|nr:DUF427 domain-containing protein [Candidatus Sulfotelmatobacter sp.]